MGQQRTYKRAVSGISLAAATLIVGLSGIAQADASMKRTYAHASVCLQVVKTPTLGKDRARIWMSAPGDAKPRPYVGMRHAFHGAFYWNQWGDTGVRFRKRAAYVVVPDADGRVPRVSKREWSALGCW